MRGGPRGAERSGRCCRTGCRAGCGVERGRRETRARSQRGRGAAMFGSGANRHGAAGPGFGLSVGTAVLSVLIAALPARVDS